MWRLIVGFFAVVGFLAVLSVAGVMLVVGGLRQSVTPLPGNILLTADLTRELPEGSSEEPLLRLLVGNKPTLRDFLDAIETAGDDPRVKGVIARVGDDENGLAKVQEVRDAIAAFRSKGKFALAFADSFGEFGPGTRPYYLATAFDEIWLQPLGNVGLTGLYADSPFLRGTLDLLGIVPEFDHREEFKTAMNLLTETKMTPAHREEVEALLTSVAGQIVRGIAQGRKLSETEVRGLIDRGPLLGAEAVQAKLVDRLGYRDEVLGHARARAGSGAELMSLANYLDRAGHPHREGSTIALIYGTGLVVRSGNGGANPVTGSNEMAATEMTRAFRAAVRDSAVRAILFRIDSPGGSAVASESIWREVVFAREIGTNAAMFSPTADFSDFAHSRLEAFLDETYKGFKDHVATGRHMTQEEVEAVAKGRVWSGEDAKARGLVDELGGYAVALRLAKQAANLPPDAPITLTVFPREETLPELIYNRLTGKEREDGSVTSGAIERSLKAVQPLLQRLETLLDTPGVLTMPRIGGPK